VDISLGQPKIFSLDPRFPPEDLLRKAEEKKTGALGTGFGGLLSRPKPEEVQLATVQQRVEPLWHVAAKAHYVYDRMRDYTVPASHTDVRAVTFLGSDFAVAGAGRPGAAFGFPVLEHCADDFREEVWQEGATGAHVPNGPALLNGPKTERADLSELSADGTMVITPEHRASAIVRSLLSKLLRPLQADQVFEESLEVECIELVFRPIVAYEFVLPAKDRRGVVEVDAITGEVKTATSLKMQISRHVSKDALFDIGADTIGLLVPGGNIALKVARLAIDRNY
jgi:hypothetical protein